MDVLASEKEHGRPQQVGEKPVVHDRGLITTMTRLTVLTWMMAANLGPTVLVLVGVLGLRSKLDEIGGRSAQLARVVR